MNNGLKSVTNQQEFIWA